MQRERAAWLSRRKDQLHEEVSERLLERLEVRAVGANSRRAAHAFLLHCHAQDIKREFPTVLVLGGAHASVARSVRAPGPRKNRV